MSQSFHRGRRLRWTPEIRSMVRETPPLLAEDLIMPYFVVETEDQSFRKEIGAMHAVLEGRPASTSCR